MRGARRQYGPDAMSASLDTAALAIDAACSESRPPLQHRSWQSPASVRVYGTDKGTKPMKKLLPFLFALAVALAGCSGSTATADAELRRGEPLPQGRWTEL